MKNLLVINGSPRGEQSTSLQLTTLFLKGYCLEQEETNIEVVHLIDHNIEHCLGCQTCQLATPGICQIRDDMDNILIKYAQADIVMFSFPLHLYSMGSLLEKFYERLNPLLLFVKSDDNTDQLLLHKEINRTTTENIVMISTCLSSDVDYAYSGVKYRLETHYGNNGLKLFIQNPLEDFCQKEINGVTFEKIIQWVGQDYARYGVLTPEVDQLLKQMSSNSEHDFILTVDKANQLFNKEKPSQLALSKLKQMESHYNIEYLNTPEAILQIEFTDLKEYYQFHLNRDKLLIQPYGKNNPECCIQTTFNVWQLLMDGKMSLPEVINSGTLSYKGEHNIMIALHNGLLFSKNIKLEELSLLLSSGRNRRWASEALNHGIITISPWIVCLIVISPQVKISFALVPLFALGLQLSKRYTDITPFDKCNTICLFVLYITYVSLSQTMEEIAIINRLLVMLVVMVMIIFVGSCFSKVPLTAYLGAKGYFKKMITIDNYISMHRKITMIYASFLLLVPLVAITGRLINISSMYSFVFAYLLICGIVTSVGVRLLASKK